MVANTFTQTLVTAVTGQKLKVLLLATCLAALSACGGGGGGSSPTPNPGPTNSAPSANAGADQAVDENSSVTLSGSGSDPNSGDTLTYSWSQTSGPSVTINNASQASANFTAPEVSANTPLVFELRVSDGSLSDTDTITVTVNNVVSGGSPGTITGKVVYEFVPPNNVCQGLNFGAIVDRPVRQATVQLIDQASSSVLDTTLTDDAGDYAFTGVAPGNVFVRVLAELKRSGSPNWDVEIRDNVVPAGTTAPPLGSRPMYALDGPVIAMGTGGEVQDLTAATGWDGSSYTGVRAAAPFAVLDAIYSGMELILSVDPGASFAPLDAFWSANNTLTSPTDIDNGELGASFYRGDIDSLFLLGDANVDTEEFDDHVIVHEWGHYFEDNFSRSDSTGGPHSIRDRLDMRLAFGEGWATALSGIALENQLYCDTGPAGSTGGFGIGTESGSYDARGWYDEISVVRFIYDLWDSNDEGGDPGSIGFAPIYNTMIGPQENTPAFTSIFSFATELRSQLNPADAAFMDSQLVREDMNPTGLDIWGGGEATNLLDVESQRDVLPVYTDLPTDGTPLQICTNDDYDGDGDGNKLASIRYLRIDVPSASTYNVSITTLPTTPALPPDDPNDPRDQSDPDMYIYRNGTIVAAGVSGDANSEVFTTQNVLQPGIHVADLAEFRYADSESPAGFPNQVCFEITMQ